MKKNKNKYSIEFFHIYTDEKISKRHTISINHLKTLLQSWSFPFELIILIDNYNPTKHIINPDLVLNYIQKNGLNVNFWAYEKDMIGNANKLLESINDKKLLKGYKNYIEKNKKYPCSLLTAAWYLTRLGYFDSSEIINSVNKNLVFEPSERLFNILPDDYRVIEGKAKDIIHKSTFFEAKDKIQNFYYSAENLRPEDLF
jgi:hypothetical protein